VRIVYKIDILSQMEKQSVEAIKKNKVEDHQGEVPAEGVVKNGNNNESGDEEVEFEAKVNGLSYDAKESDIEDFFGKAKVTAVKLLRGGDGRSRGIAFVKVATQKDLDIVLKMNKEEHMGRWLNISQAEGLKNQKNRVNAGFKGESVVTSESTTIFVGNLSFNSTEDSLYSFFQDCGKVTDARIAKRDGQSRGFGYVEFEDSTGVKKALELAGETLEGRPLKLDVATKKDDS
jgi:nucleolin